MIHTKVKGLLALTLLSLSARSGGGSGGDNSLGATNPPSPENNTPDNNADLLVSTIFNRLYLSGNNSMPSSECTALQGSSTINTVCLPTCT